MTASQMQTMQWFHLALQYELIITHFFDMFKQWDC